MKDFPGFIRIESESKSLGGISMKKLMGLILAGVLVLTLGATSVLASPFGHGIMAQRRDGSCLVNSTGWCQYVDENGDGICDNCAGTGLCTGNGRQYVQQISGENGWSAGGCHGGHGGHCR